MYCDLGCCLGDWATAGCANVRELVDEKVGGVGGFEMLAGDFAGLEEGLYCVYPDERGDAAGEADEVRVDICAQSWLLPCWSTPLHFRSVEGRARSYSVVRGDGTVVIGARLVK